MDITRDGHRCETNIVIDDKLMRETLRATGLKTKREAVELGLRTLLRLRKQGEIRRLRGKLDWQGDLNAMRRRSLIHGFFGLPNDHGRVAVANQSRFAGETSTSQNLLTSLLVVELGGQEIAIQAARNFRALRNLGVTVRKTIDTSHCHPVHRERVRLAAQRQGF